MRIKNPGRSINCTHIQCFDISFFLLMNEKKPTWTCPVCDKKLAFSSLVIDGLFTEILSSDKTLSVTEVQFDEVNNSIEWSIINKDDKKPVDTKSFIPETVNSSSSSSSGSETLKRKQEDDSESLPSKQKRKTELEVIDLGSSSEDEADEEDTLIGSTVSLSRQTSLQTNTSNVSQTVVNLSDDEGSPPIDFSSNNSTEQQSSNSSLRSETNTYPAMFPASSSSNSFNPFHSRSSDHQRSHHGLNPFAAPFTSTTQVSPSRGNNFMSAREALYASFLNRSSNPLTTETTTSSTMSNVLGSAFTSLNSSSILNPPPLSLGRHLFNNSTDEEDDDDDDVAIIE